ncbi:MAG: outer membrane lipoprotein carrier protein LolA [Candidatus Kapaibacterium sp.]|nr:MAG: outer membrane lipoprotein carrier protein LolA [Candidatus Kapabacteria bacterium]
MTFSRLHTAQQQIYTGFYALCAIVLSIAAPIKSLAQNADEIFQQVQKKYGEGVSMRVRFVLKAEDIRGSLTIKRGNKYILELAGRSIICNGKTVQNYTPVDKKVVVSDFRDNPDNISPERIFMNFPRGYRPTLVIDKASKDAVLMLNPAKARDQISDMQRVTLRLQQETLKLKEMSIFDGTQTHEWTILDIKPDAGIPDAAFEWKPPQGTQVIDLRD